MIRFKFLICVALFLTGAPKTFGQDFPDLSDNILVCTRGALPYYISCDGSTCQEEFFYTDGNIMARGKCKEGKKTGMWSAYYDKIDKIMSQGIIKEGLLYGDWVFYYENGNKKAEGEFRKGQFELGCSGSGKFDAASIMNGKWTFWNEDGSINIVCRFSPNNYKEGILNGKFTKWYGNGQKKEEGIYHNGMKNGIWTYWYSNGQKQKEEYYTYKDRGLYDYLWYECPTGTWIYWKENGNLLKKEIYKEGAIAEVINY